MEAPETVTPGAEATTSQSTTTSRPPDRKPGGGRRAAPAPRGEASAPGPAPAPVVATPAPVVAAPAPVVAAPAPVVAAPAAPAELPVAALPGPDAIWSGDPDAIAPAPGPAGAGDVRSLRGVGPAGVPRFAVVYRKGTAVVIASGPVGRRGRWQAVEYPSQAAAATAYARACARFTADGFVDL